MEYWKGCMDWPIELGWKCEICGHDGRLEWGLVHAECRCTQCHAVYYMRADDEKRTVLTIPRCLVNPKYYEAAKKFWEEKQLPIDEVTKEDWQNLGIV